MVGKVAEIASSRILHRDGYQKPHRNIAFGFVGWADSQHFSLLEILFLCN